MLDPARRARLDGGGHQVVEIVVDRGYHPATILARAGIPLRLVFRRVDDDPCTERVVFSTPRLDRRLAAAGLTTVELPAQSPGDVRFTCGMGRYRGRIAFGEPRGLALVRVFRDRARAIWRTPAAIRARVSGR